MDIPDPKFEISDFHPERRRVPRELLTTGRPFANGRTDDPPASRARPTERGASIPMPNETRPRRESSIPSRPRGKAAQTDPAMPIDDDTSPEPLDSNPAPEASAQAEPQAAPPPQAPLPYRDRERD